MDQAEITMHKIMGKHDFQEVFNKETFEKEQVCKICKHVVNTKPANAKDKSKMLDAYRYGMITADDALDKILEDKLGEDIVLPGNIDRELTIKATK